MRVVNPRPASRLTIAAAASGDAAAIAALLREAGLPHEDFADHLPYFLVARRQGEAVGAIGFELHGTAALLRSLVVAPAHRGAGLGDCLVKRLTASARRQGVRRFYLLTATAEAFFSKRGFEKIDRRSAPAAIAGTKEFNSLCQVSAVCLTRPVEAAIIP